MMVKGEGGPLKEEIQLPEGGNCNTRERHEHVLDTHGVRRWNDIRREL